MRSPTLLTTTLVLLSGFFCACSASPDDASDESAQAVSTRGNQGSVLRPSESLKPGQSIRSSNKNYRATLQDDGNFVLYAGAECTDEPLWASSTNGPGVTMLVYRADGDLALMKGTTQVWHSGSSGKKAGELALQDDGNLVLLDAAHKAYWSTKTNGGPSNIGATSARSTANARAVMLAMTSIWENDTPRIDYAYAENIHDGRGYTSGRAGFCTGTGDAILVVQCYVGVRSEANGNLMAKYMPALTTINNAFQSTGKNQGDTSLLDSVGNYVKDWAASFNSSTTQADFKACQDKIADDTYFYPSQKAAADLGLRTALSGAAFYDIWINHGEDGAKAIIAKTNAALNLHRGKLDGHTTEDAWLAKLGEVRRDVLVSDPTWVQAVDRVAGYEKARRRGNFNLAEPVDNWVKAADCWPSLAATLPDSGYTPRVINPDGSWATRTLTKHRCE